MVSNITFIRVCVVDTHKMLTVFGGNDARIGVVSWNGNILSSGSKECSIVSRDVRCNNIYSNNNIFTFSGYNQEVCGLKWSFDWTQLTSGGNDNKPIVWNIHSQKPLMCSNSHGADIKA